MYTMKVFQDVGEYITYLNTGNAGSTPFPTSAIIATGKDPGNGSWYVVIYLA